MSIAGILSQTQASDINLATSIQQWLYTQVVQPYDAAISGLPFASGQTLNSDGSYTADSNGLGVMPGMPDDESIYQRVPVVAYNIDDTMPKAPTPMGMGDGASMEYRTVHLVCLPAVIASTDGVQPSFQAQLLLKTFLLNAISRANFMPIVDHSQGATGGLFPQIGYAEIHGQRPHSLYNIKEILGANRFRFDYSFELWWAVSTTN
jgi:hypothetical protein